VRGPAVWAMCWQSKQPRPREAQRGPPPAQSRLASLIIHPLTLALCVSLVARRGGSVPGPWAGRDAATQLAPCCGPLKQCPRHGGICVFAPRISIAICLDIVPSRDTLQHMPGPKASHGTCTAGLPGSTHAPLLRTPAASASTHGRGHGWPEPAPEPEPPRSRQPPPPPGAQPSVRIQLDPATRVGAPLAQL
jgi:hypothetical protein